jgi:hypothetical protein
MEFTITQNHLIAGAITAGAVYFGHVLYNKLRPRTEEEIIMDSIKEQYEQQQAEMLKILSFVKQYGK